MKPAEVTPLTALSLAELGRRAGIPAGVLNIVVGDAPAIGKLCRESRFLRSSFEKTRLTSLKEDRRSSSFG